MHHERLHNSEQMFMFKKMNPNIEKPDVIWTNESTGGKVYVGDIKTASDAKCLSKSNIFYVINCTHNEDNFH